MELLEDGTIKLTQKETQEYITKVVNPKFKALESARRNLERLDNQHKSILNRVIQICKSLSKDPEMSKRQKDTIYNILVPLEWTLYSQQAENANVEYCTNIEPTVNLYKMLLKNRHFKSNEQLSSNSKVPPEQEELPNL